MNEGMVYLYKENYTEEDWFQLSEDFEFNPNKNSVSIHFIIDEK